MTSTPLKTSDISIIIPALNEEPNIKPLADSLAGGQWEIILVDGGSTDATIDMAGRHGFSVITSKPGRARQMNAGAQRATRSLLLFLHADTRLPPGFAEAITATLEDNAIVLGAFRLGIAKPTPAMRFISRCANLRSLLFRLPYGDQALFLRKTTFFALGMFADLPIMEDYAFVQEAKRRGKIVLLDKEVITSARRWQELGIIRTTCVNQLVVIGFHLKIPPQRLAALYGRPYKK